MGQNVQGEVADLECKCKRNQVEGWVRSNDIINETDSGEHVNATLIVGGMAVVQELIAVRNFQSGKDLSRAYIKLNEAKCQGYVAVCVVFDNYTKTKSLKENTRQ